MKKKKDGMPFDRSCLGLMMKFVSSYSWSSSRDAFGVQRHYLSLYCSVGTDCGSFVIEIVVPLVESSLPHLRKVLVGP